ncbi:hypothetical protein C6T59_08205 [Burkholderia multivorans]|nr:hypothetical protein C6Q01_07805 [Burkholderia multivorans]PRF87549.1 hypothetical protein C6Q23_20115 [Burkholderia multivorans]PRG68134.1 hypothetical protein C6T59_08205 [Burkholderia multivorans]
MSCVVLSASLREPARGTILYNIHYAIQQDGNARLAGGRTARSSPIDAALRPSFSASSAPYGPSVHARTLRAEPF